MELACIGSHPTCADSNCTRLVPHQPRARLPHARLPTPHHTLPHPARCCVGRASGERHIPRVVVLSSLLPSFAEIRTLTSAAARQGIGGAEGLCCFLSVTGTFVVWAHRGQRRRTGTAALRGRHAQIDPWREISASPSNPSSNLEMKDRGRGIARARLSKSKWQMIRSHFHVSSRSSAWLCLLCSRVATKPPEQPSPLHVVSRASAAGALLPFAVSTRGSALGPVGRIPAMSTWGCIVLPDGDSRAGGRPPRFPRELRRLSTSFPPRFPLVAVRRVSRSAPRRRERPALLRRGTLNESAAAWEDAPLDMLPRDAIQVTAVSDGSSAVLAALQLRRRRAAGGTQPRPDHCGGLRALPRGKETTTVASLAAKLSSKARQALSRADMFRFVGVKSEHAHTTAVAAAGGCVSSRRLEAAVTAKNGVLASFQAADAEAATVMAAAAAVEAVTVAEAAAQEAAATAAAQYEAEGHEEEEQTSPELDMCSSRCLTLSNRTGTDDLQGGGRQHA